MTRIALLALLVIAPGAALAAEPAKEEAKELVAWESSYSTVLKKAEASGQPVLFDFTTGWCPHCTRMDKTTWKDAKVAELTRKFVAGKVNCDTEKVPVARYRLTGYPTVVVADPAGDQVLRYEGYQDAAAIGKALEAYLAQADALKAAMATLRQDSGDPAANIVVGSLLASLAQHDRAADRFAKALKKSSGPELVSAAVGAARAYNATGKFKQAAKALEPAVAAAGASPPPALLLAQAETEAGLGQADAARALYERLKSEHPASPEATQAAKALGGG